MDRHKMIVYHILFSLAVVSVVVGAGLLLITTEHVNGALIVWPLVLIIAGSLVAYFAVFARWKVKFIFLSLMIACSALIRFVAVVAGIHVGDYWPLYVIAAGVFYMPVNYIRYGKVKPSSIVISTAFVLLGSFFSIFSFGFSSMSFKTFITRWWPALFIASGLVLLIVWFIQRLVLKNAPLAQAHEHDQASDRGKL
ncbi:MAG: hypothetical protein A2Y38_08740 [Spirochaetes bacterium GWB1_59_5]|nr:MAG: hypothetical protein A2Y38_08740 [Spirochaetes bacterium GWB1_59_5]